jgi:hypothetical protein
MIGINQLEKGSKVFHRDSINGDRIVIVRDWTEEREVFVLIESSTQDEGDWVHISELYPYAGEEEENEL